MLLCFWVSNSHLIRKGLRIQRLAIRRVRRQDVGDEPMSLTEEGFGATAHLLKIPFLTGFHPKRVETYRMSSGAAKRGFYPDRVETYQPAPRSGRKTYCSIS